MSRFRAGLWASAGLLMACGAHEVERAPVDARAPAPAVEREAPAPELPSPARTAFEKCWGKPLASDTPRELARIQELVDDGDLETAGRVFLATSRDSTAPDAAVAAMRALEVMNELGAHGDLPLPDCYDLMAEEVPRMMDAFCTPSPRAGADALCVTLRAIALDLMRVIG